MVFSAMLFCKWALTPQKARPCPFALQLFLKALSEKTSIVAVVVEDVDAVLLLGKVFEGLFGFHCLFLGELGHQVDIL